MLTLAILFCIRFVYANELGYNFRPVEHSRSGLSFSTDSRGKGFATTHNSLASAASSHQPISYNAPVGFGGYQTEFYTFTAPEDVFDNHAAVQKISESLKKKVRVIFIKNPENTAYENAVLGLIQQAAEQRTAIYVLNKQHELSDLAGQFQAIQNNINHKPEVHFVKYRTPEDAYNAQRAIQSQYDAAQSFSAPLPNTFHGSYQTPNSDYLPPLQFPGLNN